MEAKIEQRARMRFLKAQNPLNAEARARCEELDGELQGQIQRLFDKQAEIRHAIDRMEDATLRKLLEYRYINGWSLKKISCRMYISYDWLRHLHGVALLKIRFEESKKEAG